MNKLKLAFVNPPHADWQTPANLTWMLLESHYNHEGVYPDLVEFLPAPYKFDHYASFQDIKRSMDGGTAADVYCFSSYVWNHDMCDQVAKLVKKQHPKAICVLGGPHIGRNEPDMIDSRIELYDYICQITKPGEAFFTSLIDGFFDNDQQWPAPEDVTWEWRSDKQEIVKFPEYSVYEEHLDYLEEMNAYATSQNLEPFMAIESTRGCPYQCTFCEWGGGIGGKVYKKSMDVWKRDIHALKSAGYRDVYLTDANFGAFKDRDIEIFRWSFEQGINLTDISTMKSRDLKRRTDLVDAWFDVVGSGEETHSEVFVKETGSEALFFLGSDSTSDSNTHGDGDKLYISVIPTVSIQSVSDEAMRIANRVDLSLDDKIALSEHINEKCTKEGFPRPPVEMILGMPGSTIQDFYDEYEIYWNFKSLGSFRHDYMFLPDSELTDPEYIAKYEIETIEVHTDVIDEGGSGSRHGLYRNLKTDFKTIVSCFSYTREEMYEMWFMNVCGNMLLQEHYAQFESVLTPGQFCKLCYEIARDVLPRFDYIHKSIVDILSPDTAPKSLKKIGNGNLSRFDAVMDVFTAEDADVIFLNEMFVRAYGTT